MERINDNTATNWYLCLLNKGFRISVEALLLFGGKSSAIKLWRDMNNLCNKQILHPHSVRMHFKKSEGVSLLIVFISDGPLCRSQPLKKELCV